VTPAHALFLIGAGSVAGAINTAAGGGSLVSFPVLVATGHSALAANVTNTVGLVPGYLAGSVAYRRELAGQGSRARRLGLDAVVGAGLGVAALLLAPAAAFRAVVPGLLIVACLLLLAQPPLGRLLSERRADNQGPGHLSVATHAAVLLGAAYGAYFGAALGVLLLALLGLTLDEDLQRVNALKSRLQLVTNVLAAVTLAVFAPVDWAAALCVGVGSVVGGYAGAAVARRVPAAVLRVAVALIGLGAAGALLAG
jgi:uncharacterized membrane protein YfcA